MPVTQVIETDLLQRAGDLKGELLEFARSRRFSKAFEGALRRRFDRDTVAGEADVIEFQDWFVLQHQLPDGRTVVEHFAGARPDLPDAERKMLVGWRDVVEGVFEIGRRDGPALVAVNLVDELTYRMRSNQGPAILDTIAKARFMVTRLVPIGDEWMLSGAQQLFAKSARGAMVEVAAKLSMKCPRLVFRNPEKLTRGWELQRNDRKRFIEWWGADLVVVEGAKLAERYVAYWRWRVRQPVAGELPARPRTEAPDFELPEHLLEARTVGLIYDELEGLAMLVDFRLVEEVFENPGLLADRAHRKAVIGYLNDDSVSPLAFRRLAEREPARASVVFQRLLNKPGFSWERDGERLMRRRKGSHFAKASLPRVMPATGAVLEANGVSAR